MRKPKGRKYKRKPGPKPKPPKPTPEQELNGLLEMVKEAAKDKNPDARREIVGTMLAQCYKPMYIKRVITKMFGVSVSSIEKDMQHEREAWVTWARNHNEKQWRAESIARHEALINLAIRKGEVQAANQAAKQHDTVTGVTGGDGLNVALSIDANKAENLRTEIYGKIIKLATGGTAKAPTKSK